MHACTKLDMRAQVGPLTSHHLSPAQYEAEDDDGQLSSPWGGCKLLPGVSSAESDVFLFDRGLRTDGKKCLPRQRAASSEQQTYSSRPGKTTRSCSCSAKGWLSTTVTTAVSLAEKMWLCWLVGAGVLFIVFPFF